jgi:energy-coupling factor transporter ATP-binding protein EcfA2
MKLTRNYLAYLHKRRILSIIDSLQERKRLVVTTHDQELLTPSSQSFVVIVQK